MAARTTPIRAPHTKRELPKIGANIRLPKISNAITTAPVVNAVAKNQPRDQGDKGEDDLDVLITTHVKFHFKVKGIRLKEKVETD